jgi:hypothetical protein
MLQAIIAHPPSIDQEGWHFPIQGITTRVLIPDFIPMDRH